MQRVAVLLLKAAVTALLIYLSVRAVSLDAVRERFESLQFGWIVFVVAVLAAQIAVQAMRWREIVQAAGARLSAGASLQISYIAAFFNQTLPSTIGGDAARVWILAHPYKAGWRAAAYSVLVDRAIGVFALAALVVACLPWTVEFVRDPVARLTVAAIGMAGVLGGLVFAGLGMAKGTWLDRFWLTHHFVAASGALRKLLRQPRRFLTVAAASIFIHIVTVAVAWAAARSIAEPLDFIVTLCLLPPVVLLATIPVTIAGWGLRESLMITAFTLAGQDAGDALAISLIMGAANFVVGLFGGLLWLTGRFGRVETAGLRARR